MKKTKESIGYNQITGLINESLEISRARNFWSFLYASRYACQHYDSTAVPWDWLITKIFEIDGFIPGKTKKMTRREATIKIYNILYGIINTWHEINSNDAETPNKKPFSTQIENFITSLDPDKKNTINQLYQFSYELGFFIYELWHAKIKTQDILNDIYSKGLSDPESILNKHPIFGFIKKDSSPAAFKVLLKNDLIIEDHDFDILLLMRIDEKIDHIRKKLKSVWSLESKEILGDKDNYDVAILIRKESCSFTHAMDIVRLQKLNFNYYTSQKLIPIADISIPSDECIRHRQTMDLLKEYNKNVANFIDLFRLTESNLYRKTPPYNEHVRRAIGILIYDMMADTTEQFSLDKKIKIVIDLLKSKYPKFLSVFHKNFFKHSNANTDAIMGETAQVMNTVMTEMRREYHLAKECIARGDYLTRQDFKIQKKSLN